MKELKYISSCYLSDELRDLKKWGVEVPILKMSIYKPNYVGIVSNGNEVYNHAGKIITVGAGEVIDGHGNVVNLRELEQKKIKLIVKKF